MTLRIEVTIPEDHVKVGKAAEYLADTMAAIGFVRSQQRDNRYDRVVHAEDAPVSFAPESPATELASDQPVDEKATSFPDAEPAPQRERGKPAPGKARRTKAEIEEDEAADAADAAASGVSETTTDNPTISTSEERISPEDEAQDAADEAADPANAPAAEATRDDVRAAMLVYSQKKGMPALTAELTAIFNEKFPGGGVTKLSEIPEDAASFQSVIDALNAKLEG